MNFSIGRILHALEQFLVVVVISVACTFSSGDETPSPTPPPTGGQRLGTAFELRAGESADFESSGWVLTLAAIPQDSRCPLDVVCVWAGEVTASFIAAPDRGPTTSFDVTLGPATPPEGSFDAMVLRLLSVNPHPVTASPIAQNDYVVTVVVDLSSAQQRSSGVHGLVTRGPICPVARQDEPCPDEPYEAVIVVTNEHGDEVSRTTSSTSGWFAVPLPAGTYRVSPLPPPNSPFPVAGDTVVSLKPGEWRLLDIHYDTGIR